VIRVRLFLNGGGRTGWYNSIQVLTSRVERGSDWEKKDLFLSLNWGIPTLYGEVFSSRCR